MGSKCAGMTATSGKGVRPKVRRSTGRAYPSVGMSIGQSLLFPSEPLVKPLSKKEIHRKRKEERRRSFETRQPFQCGLLMPKRKPLVYEPLGDGNWQESPSGRVISHERLQEYLRKYQFI
jgi:hypothetical protein